MVFPLTLASRVSGYCLTLRERNMLRETSALSSPNIHNRGPMNFCRGYSLSSKLSSVITSSHHICHLNQQYQSQCEPDAMKVEHQKKKRIQ